MNLRAIFVAEQSGFGNVTEVAGIASSLLVWFRGPSCARNTIHEITRTITKLKAFFLLESYPPDTTAVGSRA